MNYLRTLQLRRMMAAETGAGSAGAGEIADEEGKDAAAKGEKAQDDKGEEKRFTQEDIDRIVRRTKAEESRKAEKLAEAARGEGERLAKLTADERAKADEEKRLEALNKRDADITRRELRATAIETLNDKGLPTELVEVLPMTDADTCNAGIVAVEKAFRAAVQKGVEQRLKGKEAPKDGGGTGNQHLAAFAAAAGLKPKT